MPRCVKALACLSPLSSANLPRTILSSASEEATNPDLLAAILLSKGPSMMRKSSSPASARLSATCSIEPP